jgi:hypothetical protein
MSMLVSVNVDQAAAARLGRAVSSTATVTIESSDLESWLQEIRDLFAVSLKPGDGRNLSQLCETGYPDRRYDNSPLSVIDPTPDGIRAKLEDVHAEYCARREKEASEEAAKVAEQAKLDDEWATAPAEKRLMFYEHRDPGKQWVVKEIGYPGEKYYPKLKSRMPEFQAEADRRNAEAAREAEQQKAERQKAETARLETLKAWAMEHGSELTKARIAEGFDSWQRSAADDRAKIVSDYADSIVTAIPIEEGEEPEHDEYDSEDRLSPTLEEIEALRIARANVPAGVTCKLIRETYTTNAVETDYGEEVEEEKKEYRTAIHLEIQHEYGNAVRYIILK